MPRRGKFNSIASSPAEREFSDLILKAIEKQIWAMSTDGLIKLIAVAKRENFEALEKDMGKALKNTQRATVRDGVGIIPINGPLFKRANLLTEICGATSYELILRDLSKLVNSKEVKSIILNIDSPGGDANGCAELAENIYKMRSKKKITAYIGGSGCSAAYWIASACHTIIANDTAILGSIGVQTIVDIDKSESMRFVSSQSPNKNAHPSTEAGASQLQQTIDDLAAVFISKVARNRNVTEKKVMDEFGQGAVFVGKKALAQGLCDEISNFEDLMEEETEEKNTPKTTGEMTVETLVQAYPTLTTKLVKLAQQKGFESGVKSERTRVAEVAEICDDPEKLSGYISSGMSVKDVALEMVKGQKSAPKKPKDPLSTLKEAEQNLGDLNSIPLDDIDDFSDIVAIAQKAGWGDGL